MVLLSLLGRQEGGEKKKVNRPVWASSFSFVPSLPFSFNPQQPHPTQPPPSLFPPLQSARHDVPFAPRRTSSWAFSSSYTHNTSSSFLLLKHISLANSRQRLPLLRGSLPDCESKAGRGWYRLSLSHCVISYTDSLASSCFPSVDVVLLPHFFPLLSYPLPPRPCHPIHSPRRRSTSLLRQTHPVRRMGFRFPRSRNHLAVRSISSPGSEELEGGGGAGGTTSRSGFLRAIQVRKESSGGSHKASTVSTAVALSLFRVVEKRKTTGSRSRRVEADFCLLLLFPVCCSRSPSPSDSARGGERTVARAPKFREERLEDSPVQL